MITLRIIHWLSRILLATVFLYSGYVKLQEPLQFAVAIQGYQLAPEAMIYPLATYLPWLELLLGLLLLSGWKIRYSAMATTGLLLFFIVILSITYARGIEANCGCFSLDDRISLKTIARDSLIIIPAIFLILESRILSRLNKTVPAPEI
jgi:putative oxidoreductase